MQKSRNIIGIGPHHNDYNKAGKLNGPKYKL